MGEWGVPGSSRLSRWHQRSFSVLSYALCIVVIPLCLGQVVWHWHGARSGVSVTAGLAIGVVLNLRVGRLIRRSAASGSGTQICNVLGGLAVIPTLVFVQVSEPGPVLGVAQGLADGFIAGQFAVMIVFIEKPRATNNPRA
jgi:hypothetical protein